MDDTKKRILARRAQLTTDALDPVGKIPEFKFCAIKVERAAEPSGPAKPSGNGHRNGHKNSK